VNKNIPTVLFYPKCRKRTLIVVLTGVLFVTLIAFSFDWHNLRDRLIFATSLVVDLEKREFRREKYLGRLELFASEMSKEKEGAVFLGDSLTTYFDLDAFFPGANAVNRGIAGDTTAGVLNRLDKSLSSWDGRFVFLMIGYNDLKYRRPADVLTNMRAIVGELISKGVRPQDIVIQSILPVDPRRAWANSGIQDINQGLVALAKETDCDYLDLNGAFMAADGGVKDELVLDGVHLNERGYTLWANIVNDKYARNLESGGNR
jgi:lysophospholipase L1-like esterase